MSKELASQLSQKADHSVIVILSQGCPDQAVRVSTLAYFVAPDGTASGNEAVAIPYMELDPVALSAGRVRICGRRSRTT